MWDSVFKIFSIMVKTVKTTALVYTYKITEKQKLMGELN